jgi:hypothetical protein
VIFTEPTPANRQVERQVEPVSGPTITPRPLPVKYNAILEITELTCFDGEEDDYNVSSGQDEISFIYTLIETNESGYAVRSSSYAWGVFEVVRGDSYDTSYFEDIKIPKIPIGHGLLIVLSIVEVDDYSKAQKMMDNINEFAGYVEFANMFNPEPYSKTGIEIAGKVIDYLDIALDIVDWADGNDTLADKVDIGEGGTVARLVRDGGYLYNTWVFSGNNGYVVVGIDYTDYYEYRVSYTVHLEPIY